MTRRIGILSAGWRSSRINVVPGRYPDGAAPWNRSARFLGGYGGIVEGLYRCPSINNVISGLLHRGGTILGSNNRYNPMAYPVKENGTTVIKDCTDQALANLERMGIEGVITIGGDEPSAVTGKMAASHQGGGSAQNDRQRLAGDGPDLRLRHGRHYGHRGPRQAAHDGGVPSSRDGP